MKNLYVQQRKVLLNNCLNICVASLITKVTYWSLTSIFCQTFIVNSSMSIILTKYISLKCITFDEHTPCPQSTVKKYHALDRATPLFDWEV